MPQRKIRARSRRTKRTKRTKRTRRTKRSRRSRRSRRIKKGLKGGADPTQTEKNLAKFDAIPPPTPDAALSRSLSAPLAVHLYDEYINQSVEKKSSKYPDFRVRMYNFPLDICNQLKTYDILEQYMPDSFHGYREDIPDRTVITHTSEQIYNIDNRLNYGKNRRSDPWVPPDQYKDHIDINALMIVSHKLAEKFAKDHGVGTGKNITDTELAETHYYFINQEEEEDGAFIRHIDDKSAVSYNTITVIWYLIKSPGIKGGNISFYLGSDAEARALDKDPITINTGSGENMCNCLIFTGNIVHTPTRFSGKGERSSIVFQFERKSGSKGKSKGKSKG